MATNLAINPSLLDEATQIGGLKTKKATVTLALKEFIARRRQRKVIDLFGSLSWDDNYDYKQGRKTR